jgi:inner membrane protein
LDTVTHTVLGACVGELVAGKKLGKQAMLWGALANNLPDIDVFTSLWMGQADSLLAHRGFTHSILFALIFPLLLAYLFSKWHTNKKMHFKDWVIMFGSGIFIHIIIDALTCYGTGWFEPFSHYRVAFNVLFVADPFYTIFLLIAFFVILFQSTKNKSRKTWSTWAVVISTMYIIVASINKIYVDRHIKEQLKLQNISYDNYFSTPTPLNNFLWYSAAKNDSGFHIGYYSIFDKKDKIDFQFRPRNENLLGYLPQDKDLFTLKRFSQGYYTIQVDSNQLYFNDIRFGTTEGWNDSTANFVFRYGLDKNANNDLVIQKGRFKKAGKDALLGLWERIKGVE